jgi:hypothetical protein
MKTNLLVLSAIFFTVFEAASQVGIGTTTPNAQLDIQASNSATPANNDGLLIPRVNSLSATNPTALQHGMVVFLTTTSGPRTPGFYYWDNTFPDWIKLTTGYDEKWSEGTNFIYPTAGSDMDVAIGTTFSDHRGRLLVTSEERQSGIYNQFNFQTGFAESYALYNYLNNPVGDMYGTYNLFVQNNTLQIGLHNAMTSGSGEKIGVRNIMNSTDPMKGIHNELQGQNVRGVHNELLFTSGPGYGVFSDMMPGGGAKAYGYYARFSGTDTAELYGTYSFMNSHSNSDHFGNYNFFEEYGIGVHSGQYNFFNTPNGITVGVHNELFLIGTEAYGVRNDISSGNVAYGVYNNIRDTNGVWAYGTNNFITGTVQNIVGTYTRVVDTNNSLIYGSQVEIEGGGTNTKYGFYSHIDQFAGGIHYGIFSEALKSGSFAGYFSGDVQITGTPTIGDINKYSLPTSDGTQGQVLQTDGLGQVSWAGGNVKPYVTTGSTTGVYALDASHYTVRLFNAISSVLLPPAVSNPGRIYIIIGSNGIATKSILTSGEIIYDDVTNSFINNINANQRYMLQSDGSDWIVIGR